MPTISKLPAAETPSADDLLPISQGGSVHAISVARLLASTQPAIMVSPVNLLGRTSAGPGGPDAIAIGAGLTLSAGTLSATTLSWSNLAAQPNLAVTDQLVVSDGQAARLVGASRIRGLFTAGANVSITQDGVISAATAAGTSVSGLASLQRITAIGQGDLVAVSHGGTDQAIAYSNLIDGLTIDAGLPAGQAADGDAFWVAQTGNIMVRQTLAALWPWLLAKLPAWKRTVIEVTTDIALDDTAHGNAILVCSTAVTVSAIPTALSSGFSCTVVNASPGNVAFASGITPTGGSATLAPTQACQVYCTGYSAGKLVLAVLPNAAGAAMNSTPPGPVTGVTAAALSSTSIAISWSAPASGGTVATYIVLYRLGGTANWTTAGQTAGIATFTATGLAANTSYEFAVIAANGFGQGPQSATAAAATLTSASVPSAVTNVAVAGATQNSANLSWNVPTTGGAGVSYQVLYRVSGQTAWSIAGSGITNAVFLLSGLAAGTAYDVQVAASNAAGFGPASTTVTFQTNPVSGLVSSIAWNLVPAGPYQKGGGAVGVNVRVTPGSAAVQFGFSTAVTARPTAWTAAVAINSDLWGQYVPTPSTAGIWYVWAEGTDGSSPTVYSTPFTVA